MTDTTPKSIWVEEDKLTELGDRCDYASILVSYYKFDGFVQYVPATGLDELNDRIADLERRLESARDALAKAEIALCRLQIGRKVVVETGTCKTCRLTQTSGRDKQCIRTGHLVKDDDFCSQHKEKP